MDPREWPEGWRRLFVATLPISGPLYIAGIVAFALTAVIVGLPAMLLIFAGNYAAAWVVEMWTGTPPKWKFN